MAFFFLRLSGPRPTFPFDITEGEKAAMADHQDYWRQKATVGVAHAVGPVFDPKGAFGMAVIECADQEEAAAIAASDPVSLSGLGFAWDIAPMPSIILPAR
jgi:uncharacterized protein YciI